jgi:hypothetical protein
VLQQRETLLFPCGQLVDQPEGQTTSRIPDGKLPSMRIYFDFFGKTLRIYIFFCNFAEE